MTTGPIDRDRNREGLVIGTGPAGLVAALALHHHGIDVQLLGPTVTAMTARHDRRTTALFGTSIDLLHHLGVWPAIAPRATAMTGLRLVDDTGGLMRAPELLFAATELGLASFGYNVCNSDLIEALHDAAVARGLIGHPGAMVQAVQPAPDAVAVTTSDGAAWTAGIVIGADGRNSIARAAAGIEARTWDYPQAAIATTFRHSRPHGGLSTEFHRRAGPLVVVPLEGHASSLVWVETPGEAQRLAGLGRDDFATALETALQGLLGTVGDIGPIGVFPLSGLVADPLGRSRIALAGEAGHVLPPIGAQGLNLAFRDAAWIGELTGRARAAGGDIGAPGVMHDYDAARRGDVRRRSQAVDALNRSLIADLAPVDLARGAGVALLKAVPWLRRVVMREGMGPTGAGPFSVGSTTGASTSLVPNLLRPMATSPH